MCGIGAIEGSRIQVCIPVLFTLDTDNTLDIYIYIYIYIYIDIV